MTNFIFDYADSLEYHENITSEITFTESAEFTFDEGCIDALRNNHRESYRHIAERYSKNERIFDIEPYTNDYIVLDHALVSANGVIINSDKRIFTNGGCICRRLDNAFVDKISKETNVVSITSLWSDGIWHFSLEAFVALKSIPKDILVNSKIHVSKITRFIIQICNLINIQESQLVTGNIYADKVYIPRMGKCGNPYFNQICWMKDLVTKSIQTTTRRYMILIKRNHRRVLLNYNEIEQFCTELCEKSELELYIHDDNNLPPITEQYRIFHQAKYVFAPHGAGGINLMSMQPDSWYIEFLSKEDINICFSRLAYFLNVNYKGLLMENSTVNLENMKIVVNDILK